MRKGIVAGVSSLAAVVLFGFGVSQSVSAQGGPGDGVFPRGEMRGNGQWNGQGGTRSGNGMQPGARGAFGDTQIRKGAFGPSDEAVAACSDKAEKDTCSFAATRPVADSTGGDTTVTVSGTCLKIPARKTDGSIDTTATDTKLACVPERGDGGNGGSIGRGNGISAADMVQRAESMKASRQAFIYRIETRVDKVIAFLTSKNVASGLTDAIKSDEDTFKGKADTLLAKYDAYIALLKDDSSSVSDKTAAREAIRSASQDMMTYFSGTLRKSIADALNTVAD